MAMVGYILSIAYTLIALQCALVLVRAHRARAIIMSLASLLYCSGVPKSTASHEAGWTIDLEHRMPSVAIKDARQEQKMLSLETDHIYHTFDDNRPFEVAPNELEPLPQSNNHSPHFLPAGVATLGDANDIGIQQAARGGIHDFQAGPSAVGGESGGQVVDSSRIALHGYSGVVSRAKRQSVRVHSPRPDTQLQIKRAQKNVEKGARKGISDAKKVAAKSLKKSSY